MNYSESINFAINECIKKYPQFESIRVYEDKIHSTGKGADTKYCTLYLEIKRISQSVINGVCDILETPLAGKDGDDYFDISTAVWLGRAYAKGDILHIWKKK